MRPAAAVDYYEFNKPAIPKLSLYTLPSKHFRESPAAMLTPPTKNLASVPFQWEEAPGKPRSSSSSSHSLLSTPTNNNKSSSNSARRLELPPRLLLINNNNSSNIIDSSSSSFSNLRRNASYSPTMVLDGPYRSYSWAAGRSFSLRENSRFSFRSPEEEMIREAKYRQGKCAGITKDKDTSWDWGSVKDRTWSFAGESFSPSFTSSSFKPPRIKRRSSFASFSQTSIYGSFKQVVHWRSRQDQNKI